MFQHVQPKTSMTGLKATETQVLRVCSFLDWFKQANQSLKRESPGCNHLQRRYHSLPWHGYAVVPHLEPEVMCVLHDMWFRKHLPWNCFSFFFPRKKTAKKTPLAGLDQQFPLVQYMRTPLSSAGNYGKLASLCNSTAMVLPKKCSCRFFGCILLWTHLIKSPKFQPETRQPTQQKIRASSDSDKVFIGKTS